MKKIFSVIIFSLLINCSFSQDLSTLLKLHDFSISLGSSNYEIYDTLLMNARIGRIKIKISQQLEFLLKAAELYSIKDYENSCYYAKKVRISENLPEYYNLKILLLIGNYANLKDIENTAKTFYIINNKIGFIDPNNMKNIRSVIRNNFTKEAFSDELSHYYYYHQRLKLIDEIGFVE